MPAKAARKNARTEAEDASPVLIPGAVSATVARDVLGKLLNRASYGNERIPITERGEVKAWIIGPKDFAALQNATQSGGDDFSNVREQGREAAGAR